MYSKHRAVKIRSNTNCEACLASSTLNFPHVIYHVLFLLFLDIFPFVFSLIGPGYEGLGVGATVEDLPQPTFLNGMCTFFLSSPRSYRNSRCTFEFQWRSRDLIDFSFSCDI